MNTPPKIVYFGGDDFRSAEGHIPSLEALLTAGYAVAAIVTKPNLPQGRGLKTAVNGAERLALAHHIPVLQASKLADLADEIRRLQPNMGVLVSLGQIVPASIIEIFPQGILNLHPSLLPKYRGPAPIEAAILAGDNKTGVTLMQISEELDAGPIYAQIEHSLSGRETRLELAEVLSKLGAQILQTNLEKILAGNLEPMPQDESKATFTAKVAKSDGAIDWQKPAAQIEREIRAYLGWPGSYTTLFGKEITVTEAHVIPADDPELQIGEIDSVADTKLLMVPTGNGKLCIDRLKPAGKNEMSASEFIRGYLR